jgi:hypothetical protein
MQDATAAKARAEKRRAMAGRCRFICDAWM